MLKKLNLFVLVMAVALSVISWGGLVGCERSTTKIFDPVPRQYNTNQPDLNWPYRLGYRDFLITDSGIVWRDGRFDPWAGPVVVPAVPPGKDHPWGGESQNIDGSGARSFYCLSGLSFFVIASGVGPAHDGYWVRLCSGPSAGQEMYLSAEYFALATVCGGIRPIFWDAERLSDGGAF
jgi:hypothetical protein